jgi:hypothetical protein
VDSGSALKLIEYLKKSGDVVAVLGGTMGRLDVIDAGLLSPSALAEGQANPSGILRLHQIDSSS